MNEPIVYIDRVSGKRETEMVFGESFLKLLYGDHFFSKIFGKLLLNIFAKNAFASSLFGWWQKQPWTARNIVPFIEKYKIDSSEFLENVNSFTCFNDFFIRKLKPASRPIAVGSEVAIIPADGRYLFHQQIDQSKGFVVKGQKFDLASFLESDELAKEYSKGSMMMARLCPTDYHRFHFPVDCTPEAPELINGWLYSVNPIAIKKDINIFTQNKRALTILHSPNFGKIIYVEIGATNVGSIVETYTPGIPYPKGSEKGYFSFGGSSLIVLFPPNTITFDSNLIAATAQGLEIKCLMGQSMGKKTKYPDIF